ncbi:hypothetical protein [Mycobacteroides abscessus]|uniref:Bacteriophage protein n=1 Tax=Mycobacteroides abscessus subsp. abscessus TaxID=1185650 RepID=A0AB38D0I6_9MYCO|nr:hypothetical protein [Mycobacteroides abscessus]SIA10913.1 Uncharacterised protein [Mycobacteroides abscessus subsp. abscessus]SIB13471.1 Uncharacterised protein [Mycobacteroides abscessus subsp. abscessus]SIB15195.1 Uncharacterised protein [Mycobacteroides abscessus subsp. abscessus]SIB17101.1 Uncharacterised protein [Mycobacteroides abscessus subsp. abscessus]SKR44368.1 Uncharacterised protein [Mycobacteroides abscessus subsp. abscessus]
MTMPSGSDPSGYDLSGHDGGVVGAGLGDLAGRQRGPIEDMLKARVQNTTSLNNASDAIFHGLNAALGLPLAILEALINRLFPGLNIDLDGGMEAFLNSLKEVPLLGDIVKWITGVADGGIAELKLWFDNLKQFLAHIDFNSPTFNPLAAAGIFIDMILAPVGKLATLIGGLLSGSVIPGLDASKIVSGQFAQDMIAGLGGVLNGINSMINQVIDIFRGVLVTPINQALQDVKDWWNALTGKTSNLTHDGNLGIDKVTSLVENLGNMLSGVKKGADGTTTGTSGTLSDQIDQAKDSLLGLLGLSKDALKSAIAAQTTLQEQETEQNTGGGNSYSFVFSGADGAALNSTDWTTGPNPGDITIRGDSGYAGVKNGNPDGYFFASPNYTYATDGQSASFVLGDTQNGNYYSGVYIRCDSGRTQGAYCLAKEGEIRIGKFTRSGGSWSFSAPLTLQTGLSAVKQGARIEIRCSGNNYFVRVNGRQILSATDAGNTISIGAAYRYSMFSVQRASPFFTYDSYRIAAFAMSDYTSAGAGFSMSNSWSIRRDSTADVTYGPYSSGAFPSGFFTFNDYTTDVTLDDLGTARIEIATTGLYRISTTYRSVTAKGTSVPYWVVYKNGTRITGAIPSGCPFEIPLVAGDIVQPGFIAVDYDVRSDGSTGSERVVSRSITALSGIATFDGRRIA